MHRRAIVAFTVLTLGSAACADATSLRSGDARVEHPTGADRIVLRVSTGGGFTAPEYQLRLIPEFSLFGDGTLITPGAQIEIYPSPALPSVQTQTVDEDGLQAILQAAIDAGVDAGHDMTDMGSTLVADAPTTSFTINVNGDSHSFDVYALGVFDSRPQGMTQDEYEARSALMTFVQSLGDLPRWLPDGSLGEMSTYGAGGARVYIGDVRRDEQLRQPAIEWPLDPPLASFGQGSGNGYPGYRCAVVSGTDWSEVLQPLAASANELSPWTSQGAEYGLVFRPLLPDETAC